jgi:hypothetical protein
MEVNYNKNGEIAGKGALSWKDGRLPASPDGHLKFT